ncbi:hypothetical protein ACFE04_022602 [Oxalis oulophora]
MSLALIGGYSSAEEEEEENDEQLNQQFTSDEDEDGDSDGAAVHRRAVSYKSPFDHPVPSANSALPSAFDAFTEISGPPRFLQNAVEEQPTIKDVDEGRSRHRREKKDLPAGALVEAKAQLVGIHERVRSDIDSKQKQAPKSSVSSSTEGEGKRVVTAANPNAEDAAELLRMCLQCSVPKTFSSAKGMVCPLCGDRPATDASNDAKKKGSTVKDKEKSKRMRGQSSHASWKSETEMQLRQHFD